MFVVSWFKPYLSFVHSPNIKVQTVPFLALKLLSCLVAILLRASLLAAELFTFQGWSTRTQITRS